MSKFQEYRRKDKIANGNCQQQFKREARLLEGEVQEKVSYFKEVFAPHYEKILRSIIENEKQNKPTWQKEVAALKLEVISQLFYKLIKC